MSQAAAKQTFDECARTIAERNGAIEFANTKSQAAAKQTFDECARAIAHINTKNERK